jgi:hypothetical protein
MIIQIKKNPLLAIELRQMQYAESREPV